MSACPPPFFLLPSSFLLPPFSFLLPPFSFLLPPLFAGLQLQALDRNVPRRAPTATSGSKFSPPYLHRKLRIRAFPAGPPPQAQDESDPHRTFTAKPDQSVFPAGPPPQFGIRVFPSGTQLHAPDQSVPSRTSENISDKIPERMSEWHI